MQGNSTLEQRWKLIKEAFCGKQIRSSIELEKAILSYNSRYNNIWNFNRFHEFVDQVPPFLLLNVQLFIDTFIKILETDPKRKKAIFWSHFAGCHSVSHRTSRESHRNSDFANAQQITEPVNVSVPNFFFVSKRIP